MCVEGNQSTILPPAYRVLNEFATVTFVFQSNTLGAEGAIARVPQTRDNKAVFIDMLINSGSVDI
jgi:hypothetical protein